MLDIIYKLFSMYSISILIIGIGTGWIVSYFLRSRRYYLRVRYLIQKLEDREEWIKLLEQQNSKTI